MGKHAATCAENEEKCNHCAFNECLCKNLSFKYYCKYKLGDVKERVIIVEVIDQSQCFLVYFNQVTLTDSR